MRKIVAPLLTFLVIACSSDNSTVLPETSNNAPIIVAKTFAVVEHSEEGSLIGTVDVLDDDNKELTFTITSEFDIEINEETGELTTGPNLNLDFETLQEMPFTVSVFDGSSITEKDFSLDIQDIDEMTLLTEEQNELISYFKLLTLWEGPNNTPVDFNQKWGSTMKMYLDGSITNDFSAMVESVISEYNDLTAAGNFAISLTDNLTDSNAHVFFGTKNEVEAIWPDMFDIIKDKNYDGYAMTPSQNAVLVSTRIWVSSEYEVLFKHELGHSLGFGHSDRCDDEKSFMCSTIEIENDILPIEEKVIRYLYHSDMSVGLSELEIETVLAHILINE